MHKKIQKTTVISKQSSRDEMRRPSLNLGILDFDSQSYANKKPNFWIKKTVGPETPSPTIRKKTQTNPQVYQTKVQAKIDDKEVIFDSKDITLSQRFDSSNKISVIHRAQRELITEIQIILGQQVPRLSACQKVFESLNKNIKLAFRACRENPDLFEKMIDQHIEGTTFLFKKVVSHANQFMNSNKSTNIIYKNIELEKENNRLMDLHLKTQSHQYNRKMKNQTEISKAVNFKDLDFDSILQHNFKKAQAILNSSSNIEDACQAMVKSFITLQKSEQNNFGVFELADTFLTSLTAHQQGQEIIKKIMLNVRRSNQNNSAYLTEQGLSNSPLCESIIIQSLRFQFDLQIMEIIKSNIKKFQKSGYLRSISENKISLKELIHIANKLLLIKDTKKHKQILKNLLSRSQIMQKGKLNQKQIEQTAKYIDEGYNHIALTKQFIAPLKNIKNMSKPSVSSSFSLTKRSSMVITVKPHFMNQQPKLEPVQQKKSPDLLIKQTYVQVQQTIILLYLYLSEQIQFMQHSLFTYFQLSYSLDSIEDFNSLLQKVINKDIYNKIDKQNVSQKQSLLSLTSKLRRCYESIYNEECKITSLKQLIQITKKDILNLLSKQENKAALLEVPQLMKSSILNKSTKQYDLKQFQY